MKRKKYAGIVKQKAYQKAKLANTKRWQAKYPEKAAAMRAAYTASVKGRSVLLWHSAKSKAKKANVSFTLTLEHVERGIRNVFCPKTGIMFDLSPGKGSKTNPYAPSLDRINAGGSYSDANVQIVVWFYNWMRGDHTESQLLDFCARIVEHSR